MLVVQAIRYRDLLVVPARMAGLVPAQQQDGAAARVEGVQHPIGTTGVLDAQLAQVRVLRGGVFRCCTDTAGWGRTRRAVRRWP